MSKLTILGAVALALLAGCPKQDHAATDAAPSATASAAPQATSAAPDTTAAPSASGTAKPVVKLPTLPLDGGIAVTDAGALIDSGLALLADAGPMPTPSASGSAQPASMPPECTAYLAKADACNAKRPPSVQAGARAAVAAQRAAWDTLLKQGQAAAVLTQCKATAAALAADPACK